MREFLATGQLVSTSMIEDKGFNLGDSICRKSDKTGGVIKEIFSNNIVLTGHDQKDYTLPVIELLSGDWKHEPKQQQPEEVKDPQAWREALEHSVLRAQVVREIHDAVGNMVDITGDVRVLQRPRGVVTKKKFKKHQCVLIPVTTKIEIKDPADTLTASPQCIVLGARKLSNGLLESNVSLSNQLFLHMYWFERFAGLQTHVVFACCVDTWLGTRADECMRM